MKIAMTPGSAEMELEIMIALGILDSQHILLEILLAGNVVPKLAKAILESARELASAGAMKDEGLSATFAAQAPAIAHILSCGFEEVRKATADVLGSMGEAAAVHTPAVARLPMNDNADVNAV